MAFRCDFDATNKILRISFDGVYGDRELYAACDALKALWDSHGPWHCIADFTDVTKTTVSSNAVREVAYRKPFITMDCSIMGVAPQSLDYGLARMFELLSAGFEIRKNVRVFRTMKEALVLLGVASPTYTQISANTALR
jgi:hypothetical protein